MRYGAKAQGEVSRSERIRELYAKGYTVEQISVRVQLKQSDVRRAIERNVARAG